MEERFGEIELRLVAVEDMNWRLTGRINALEMVCASLFAEALAHKPKDKRVETAQAMFQNFRSEARRAALYDQSTPEGKRLSIETSKEMDHIISLFVEYLGRMAA
jgi:hypothetical protein